MRLVTEAARAYQPGRLRRRCAILVNARWEAQYLPEWLAYHQTIGFGHVFLTCNDDDPEALWEAVLPFTTGTAPFVTFSHFPFPGQRYHMHRRALEAHARKHEWFMLLDADEFVHLPGCQDVERFLDRFPPDCDAISLNRIGFGASGFAQRPPGGALRTCVRRQAGLTAATRSFIRSDRLELDRLHQPAAIWADPSLLLAPGPRIADSTGAPVEGLEVRVGDSELAGRLMAAGLIHHYPFKSEQDVLLRVARGTMGDFGGQAVWRDLHAKGQHRALLAELNAVEDRSLAEFWTARLAAKSRRTTILSRPGFPNIALGKPATQSSVSQWSSAPDPRQDAAGLVSGRITGGYQCHTLHEERPWWQVDLGGATRVHQIRVFNRCDTPALAQRARALEIAASADGATWFSIHRRVEETAFGGADGEPLVVSLTNPVPAQRLKLTLLAMTNLHLDQVEVYGEPG